MAIMLPEPIAHVRPYRAPELLFGAHAYDAPAIDLWGLGVYLADILRGSTPLFNTSFGDIGLAASIFRVRGHPSHSWPVSPAPAVRGCI